MGTERGEARYLEFVYLGLFERTADGVLDDEDRRHLENDLLENPRRGEVQPGTGGVRKVRVALEGRGKRGGARVAYLYVETRETIYFVLAFRKNVQANLTAAEKTTVRKLVETLKKEP